MRLVRKYLRAQNRRVAPSSPFRLLSFLTLAAACVLLGPKLFLPAPQVPAPLTQEAYVWQRAPGAALQTAIRKQGPAFARLTHLAAELSWPAPSQAAPSPEIVRVTLPPPPAHSAAIGLALRVHRYRGSFAPEAPVSRRLAELAQELVARAEAQGYRVEELQLDFDAAESQLDAYREWIALLRRELAPLPVVFTALPAWLDRPRAFRRLARGADGFVLQVHSLALPASADTPFSLCEPGAALAAARRAARAGVPFRVALPTYAYEVVFDARRRFAGLAADGSARFPHSGETRRVVRSDPAVLAGLVSIWQRQRPPELTGLIWYRLPVGEERLNWPWPTLAAVMESRAPVARAELHLDIRADGLAEITLRNTGEAELRAPLRVALRWTGARRLAADALDGFTFEAETADGARLVAPGTFRRPPASARPVAWLRFDAPPESFHATLLP